jgi:nucleotide-binding universal stress UspA family protein
METIVVGYDDTEPSKRALDRAAELAKALGAKLIVTSVAPVLVPVGGRGIDADFQRAIGEPADTIVQLAEERNADMIVVGTREPNVLERLLGTSVSQSVSRRASCDVLIVH